MAAGQIAEAAATHLQAPLGIDAGGERRQVAVWAIQVPIGFPGLAGPWGFPASATLGGRGDHHLCRRVLWSEVAWYRDGLATGEQVIGELAIGELAMAQSASRGIVLGEFGGGSERAG
jgi:hypothetical protein